MKSVFLEARCDEIFVLENFEHLPKTIGLCGSIQFLNSIEPIKKQLEESGREVKLIQGRHSKHMGQILGCDVLHGMENLNVEAFLYIGDGVFHPKAIILRNEIDVFCYDPFTKQMKQLADFEKLKKMQKVSISKFHMSDEIGIIVTIKPGQNQIRKAEVVQEKYKDKKNIYMFLCDNVEFNQFENFPFIQCWVNTACPRISYDDMMERTLPIVDADDII